jgi:tripartite motif-containing protein 71
MKNRSPNVFLSSTMYDRNNRVQRFTKDGEFLSAFGREDNGDGELNLPWGVTAAPSGDLYVADWRNDRIQRFSATGDFVAKYGGSGSDEGRLSRPSSVAMDENGYMYVADWGNDRLQVLDPDGGYVQSLTGQATLSPWA